MEVPNCIELPVSKTLFVYFQATIVKMCAGLGTHTVPELIRNLLPCEPFFIAVSDNKLVFVPL